ncbi:MAG: hypothetical protein WC851_00600 [Candidatus Shapirobacteria bacterium]|jgi:glutathione synthase/RimK-type ligase-like ATP-grasp enzyme
MTKLTSFDVLIVYAQSISKSASDTKTLVPFPVGSINESYNVVYGYFLEICEQQSLTAAFTTSADIIGPGFCKSYWTFKDKKWHKFTSPGYSTLIFDKFSPTKKDLLLRRQLMFSDPLVKPFNDPFLFSLFFDKQLTYNSLSAHAIPTVALSDRSLEGVTSSCNSLSKLRDSHVGSKDFGTDIILKDRYGAGGRRVYKFSSADLASLYSRVIKNTRVSYIIQPFVKFDKGFSHKNVFCSTDIRLIYLNGKIIQQYIRVAKVGDFRCNEHQGGVLTYIPLSQIPELVVKKSNIIANGLLKSKSLYALDFIVSNNHNIYLLEGNTSPGLDWNMNLIKNETEAKKLINLIVSDLSTRISPKEVYPRRPFISYQKSITVPLND